MSVIGFDIGNENCIIAAVKTGGVEVLDNEFSSRFTPTYVGFTKKSRHLGTNAKCKLVMNVDNTIFGFKKILGQKFQDSVVQSERPYLPFDVFEAETGEVGVKVSYLNETVFFSATQIMTMMLTKLKEVSENKLGKKVKDCVISVPMYYTDSERRAMLDAAKIADLNALRLMNEPTAVALAYGYYKQDLSDTPHNVIFVDFGNSALTVSACAFYEDKFRVLGSVWNRNIGGRDFDNILVTYFAEDFKNRYQIDVMTNKKALLSLMMECESLKKQMSASVLELNFCIECFMYNKDVCGKMKRELFEQLSSPILMTVEKTLYNILEVTSLKPESIHSVQIVGGSCRIPAVKMLIQKVFNREPSSTLNMDEAVSRGCALQCALLSPSLRTKDFVIEDIQPYSMKLGFNIDKSVEPLELFPLFHKVPASKVITFNTSKPFSLGIFYANMDSSSDLVNIAEFTCEKMPSEILGQSTKVVIKAFLNHHGIFEIMSAHAISKCEDDSITKNVEGTEVEDTMMDSENELKNDVTHEEGLVPAKPQHQIIETSYPLDMCPKYSSIHSVDLNDLAAKEKRMVERDINEKERADVRNTLEEYVLEMRSKINSELEEFVTDEERKSLEELFNDTETWLYDDEDRKREECFDKLTALKFACEPVLKRFDEWSKTETVLQDFTRILQEAFDAINATCKDVEDSKTDEVQSIQCTYQGAQQYLGNSKNAFAKLQKNETSPLTAAMVENEMRNFEQQYRMQMQKLKTSIVKSEDECGDGKKEDEEIVSESIENELKD